MKPRRWRITGFLSENVAVTCVRPTHAAMLFHCKRSSGSFDCGNAKTGRDCRFLKLQTTQLPLPLYREWEIKRKIE